MSGPATLEAESTRRQGNLLDAWIREKRDLLARSRRINAAIIGASLVLIGSLGWFPARIFSLMSADALNQRRIEEMGQSSSQVQALDVQLAQARGYRDLTAGLDKTHRSLYGRLVTVMNSVRQGTVLITLNAAAVDGRLQLSGTAEVASFQSGRDFLQNVESAFDSGQVRAVMTGSKPSPVLGPQGQTIDFLIVEETRR
ncbi:MAG: hypothetical protein MH204_02780 [Fimbriimonadaceae bacterium]|nr:hypothetical protein [Fimbriimonadaceae bacterium]